MVFRSTTRDSVFVSAVAAGALVAATTAATTTTTADNDVPFKDSVAEGNDGRLLWSSNNKNTNDILHYVPSNTPDNKIRLENNRSKEKTTATGTTRRLLRNNNLTNDGDDRVGGKPVNRNDNIDLGVLDNSVPADTTGELDLDRELADFDLDAYCDLVCPSPRKKLPYGTNMQSLLSYCFDADGFPSGKCDFETCYGDGDDFNYKCPSQINCWKTSAITDMHKAFYGISAFNIPLRCWDVSSVTDMSKMFMGAASFDQDISEWDVSSVTNMESMFDDTEFNQPLDSWDVSSVTTMESMFRYTRRFNQTLELWDVSSVTTMEYMFRNAEKFDQPLQSWDVSSVTTMAAMFGRAVEFDQPLESWDVSSVTSMEYMFGAAIKFDQCLSSWAIKTIDDPESLNVLFMFSNANCPNKDDPDVSKGPWCQYSSNYCSSCYDDPGFRFEGQESKNCEWAALELIEQHCLKEGVSEGCPRTCNPVCSGTTCVNDPDFRLGGVEAKSCEWVAKQKTNERCKKPGVFAACPETCDPACATVVDCTDDQDFQLNGLKGKNCEWVGKQKTDERCKKTGVMASCRQTCNPKCGCRDSMDEFQFQGITITCKDLDIINCDAEPTPSSDEFTLAQLMQLQELLDPIHQRLDAIEDAVVEEGSETQNAVRDRETFRDLCPNKCKTCV